jgi:poly(hydroxyalkanoate) depolymerase family esterase
LRKISDTIARLTALHARSAGERVGSEPGQNRLRQLPQFGLNPGSLSGSYYIPSKLPDRSPLVVVLHGCTQTAAGYDHHSGWSRLADEAGFALLYPEQRRGNNPNLCFNWFIPGDTKRHSGEVASIRQMIEAVVAGHNLDRARVFVTGLSAGGAMAASMLATYPDVFAGGAVIAGLAHGSAKTVPEAFDRMRGHGLPSEMQLQRILRDASDHDGPWPRLSIWQGTADPTVADSNAQALAAQWRGVHQVTEPTSTEVSGALTRHVWRKPSGEAVIEVNMIAGMGHGTPVGANLGAAGPFMLDVGISSTREIANFWGVANMGGDRASPASGPQLSQRRSSYSDPLRNEPAPQQTAADTPRRKAPDASGVQKIIENALRSAGLMR